MGAASPNPSPPPSAADVLALARRRPQWRRPGPGCTVGARRRTRRGALDGSRRLRRSHGVMRRVRTLKTLVPNAQSMAADSLFAHTAGYIARLRMRVELMKAVLRHLSTSASAH